MKLAKKLFPFNSRLVNQSFKHMSSDGYWNAVDAIGIRCFSTDTAEEYKRLRENYNLDFYTVNYKFKHIFNPVNTLLFTYNAAKLSAYYLIDKTIDKPKQTDIHKFESSGTAKAAKATIEVLTMPIAGTLETSRHAMNLTYNTLGAAYNKAKSLTKSFLAGVESAFNKSASKSVNTASNEKLFERKRFNNVEYVKKQNQFKSNKPKQQNVVTDMFKHCPAPREQFKEVERNENEVKFKLEMK